MKNIEQIEERLVFWQEVRNWLEKEREDGLIYEKVCQRIDELRWVLEEEE
ncbi:MAG: hypothetical protein JRD89_04875 [Deltaproteobacteria bacterium]|nr:hypothetical protein [Deltaproteobacteria bacterium]